MPRAWKTVPADASLIPPALDLLREHSDVGPGEVPGLLEWLARVPDPRGVRHALAVVLTLTGCAVLTGATSLLAVGEWIADAPPHVLERLGLRPDPVHRPRTRLERGYRRGEGRAGAGAEAAVRPKPVRKPARCIPGRGGSPPGRDRAAWCSGAARAA
ncbi:transposase family protein [Streptomyces sp. NPDC047841]|uniref:transposase family protein n=1 Tax=Streptomyces sp. NPDC047841 TaxID=3154708 RepID=UPI003455B47D